MLLLAQVVMNSLMGKPAVEESYSEVTQDIRVSIVPQFVERESDPQEAVYAYSYHVTLENIGRERVQLINRHWVIVSGGRQIGDVKGEGVVGQQPVIEPGAVYEYTSWTVVRDAVGSMYGIYTFYSESGEFFDVKIPEFHLVYLESDVVH